MTDKAQGLLLLGVGLMGGAMGERLLAEGWPLAVWNRNPAKVRPLAELGARVVPTPADGAAGAASLLLTLSDAPAIDAVLDTLSPASLEGKRIIQLGTIAPAESRALRDRLERCGAAYVEAPVLGSTPEARSGKLLVMAGGREAEVEASRPVLESLGSLRYIGPVGQAAVLKLAMNQLIAGLTATFSLSLGMVREHGVAVEDFMGILRASALYAPTFDKKLTRMIDGDFGNRNFPERHLLKDVRLFQRAAAPLPLDQRLPRLLAELLDELAAQGHGDEDYSVLYRAIHRA